MSNSLAIAAVTTTLQNILTTGVTAEADLIDTTVTWLPLDKARGTNTNNQLNLFLYQVLPNPAWRNMDMPRQLQPGETGKPPLPLNLHYLLTAFGRDDDVTQPFGHELLGKAMSVLHDHAILTPTDIQLATAATLPDSDLQRQLENVRLTLQPFSIEEISKLWTGFATQYRLSAAYEVSVTLIESTQPVKAPLPVLARGKDDQGFAAQGNLTPPFPTLVDISIPKGRTVAEFADTLTLTGLNLDGTNVGVVFNNPLLAASIERTPNPGATSTSVSVDLPNPASVWPAGFYTLEVMVQKPGEPERRATNQLALAIAPSMTITPGSAAGPSITYTAKTVPDVFPEQRASLLLGDQEILASPHAVQTSTLTFAATNLVAGDYFVRLRIDGVDSQLVDRSVTPPVFDKTQVVTVT